MNDDELIEIQLHSTVKTEEISAYLFAMGCEGVRTERAAFVIVCLQKNNWSGKSGKGLSDFSARYPRL
jgi:hypothetical protein